MEGTRTSRTTHAFCRRAASLVLAAGALLPAAVAQAESAADFVPGAPAFEAAAQIARDHWQATPCGGTVDIAWTGMSEVTNATSSWSNPVSAYDASEQNTRCQIAFNETLAWDWTRFCSILVHEYGHLTGHAHADDGADVMYAYYTRPVAACEAAAPAPPADAKPMVAGATSWPHGAQRVAGGGRAARRGRLVRAHDRREARRGDGRLRFRGARDRAA